MKTICRARIDYNWPLRKMINITTRWLLRLPSVPFYNFFLISLRYTLDES